MSRYKIIRKFLTYVNLESERDDFETINETIKKDIIFKGTNLWILVFAIIVASVGLNMNSTAVIIGAMLISPLMGPINGMGYSIATYNFDLFKTALKNFLFAVIASLVASTAYFLLSPISTAHSELLARTSPTIYDVLIAFFGGMAGIVAISSKQKGNVIPGVAIATALMPPLCTAGYGLATAQFYYFFGAFYLFTINTVFIAISSVVISQILKFPITTIIDKNQKKKVNTYISVIITLVLIPSIFFGYQLVLKEKFMENANRFIKSVSIIEGNYLLKNEVNPNSKTITLMYGGGVVTEEQKNAIKEKAVYYSLNPDEVKFFQGSYNEDVKSKNTELQILKDELNRLNSSLVQKSNQLDSIKNVNSIGSEIYNEIHSLYPQIYNCTFSESPVFQENAGKIVTTHIVVLSVKNGSMKAADKQKIHNWLKERLKSEDVKVFYD